jgi:hypothetical protein
MKDCGPMCCIQQYFCGECIWGSVMEAGGQGSCCGCCMALACFPECTIMMAGMNIAKKYDIEESCLMACLKAFFCPCCYAMQIENEVMTKEGLNFGCCAVAKGGPDNNEMER